MLSNTTISATVRRLFDERYFSIDSTVEEAWIYQFKINPSYEQWSQKLDISVLIFSDL